MSAHYAMRALARFPRRLLSILLYLFTLLWLTEIIAMIRRRHRDGQRGEASRKTRRGRPLHCAPRCAVVKPDVYKRADPLIYSQRYLMEQGLAVTWDNPDIQLYEHGVPVSSHALKADTEYDVVATVYNNSLDAPAVGLPVEFSFRTFGVGAAISPIGTTVIDLPVKGAPQHPAKAKTVWRTPAAPGHYCLLVSLVWSDDANPKNNIGQENTDVGVAASPAVFIFPVRNEDTIRKRIHMTADAYTIPTRMGCNERPPRKESDRRYATHKRVDVFVPPSEKDADWTLARARHDAKAFPIPTGWSVDIQKPDFELAPGASQDVRVSITPPDGFRGARSFNVNAMYGSVLLGGVTLAVTK
jgi:hypothetical protein